MFLYLANPLKASEIPSSKFKEIVGSNKKIMLAFTEANNEYAEYSGSIIKEKLQKMGYEVIDPDMLERVKKDQWLRAVINNDTETMIQITTGFGSDILIRCQLKVESHPRFTAQWEGSASLNITVIDAKTAKELTSTHSDPLGSTQNPMPVEESALVAKQVAVKKATENVALKLGLLSSEDIYGSVTFSPKFYKTIQSNNNVARVLFTPDSRNIAIIGDYSVDIVDVHSGRHVAKYEVPDSITSVGFSRDGELIAIGIDGNSVYIYERKTNLLRKKYSGDCSVVVSLVFNNDSSFLAAGFKDGHIELVDVKQGERIGSLSAHSKRVHSLAFTPNDRFLISFGEDLLTKFWDVNVKRETRSFKEPMDRLFSACLSVDGSLMGLNTKDIHIDLLRNRRIDKRFLVIRNTSTGEETKRFEISKDILAIAFHHNKRYIASASEDNTIRIWDINTGAEISVLSLEKPAVSLDFSNDGKMLVYTSGNIITILRL